MCVDILMENVNIRWISLETEPSLLKCVFDNSATEYGIIYIENR